MAAGVPVDVTGRPTELRDLDLSGFFSPQTVALIGASDNPKRPNAAMTRKLLAWAAKHGAEIYLVNPNRDAIDGQPCLPSIDDLPDGIDLAVILVGDAVDAYETVLAKTPRFAVIFSAGFAETGAAGARLQAKLERLVATGETRLLGPNTNLNAFESFTEGNPGRAVALITQSGHQGRPLFQAQDLGLRLSAWAPTGNEVDLEFADFARWFADQPETGVIATYIEGFKDGRTLMLAADHTARRGVPMVVVKVGKTAEGASMAQSHTGHLTGSDAVTSAVFRQFGVIRVDGLDELQDTATLLSRAAPPIAQGVCIYAISGGTGAHLADLAAAEGLTIPDLTQATQDALRGWIPDYLRVSNPVDCGGAPSTDWRGRKILDALVADPRVGVLICPITGALPTMSRPLAEDLVAVAETTDKPIVVIWGSPLTDDPAYTEVLVPSGLPVFRTFGNCVGAVKAHLDHHAFAAALPQPVRQARHPPRPRRQDRRRPPRISFRWLQCALQQHIQPPEPAGAGVVGVRGEGGAGGVRDPGHRRPVVPLPRRGGEGGCGDRVPGRVEGVLAGAPAQERSRAGPRRGRLSGGGATHLRRAGRPLPRRPGRCPRVPDRGTGGGVCGRCLPGPAVRAGGHVRPRRRARGGAG